MDLDVVVVALLCGTAFVLASVLWHLHVQPDTVLTAFERRSLTDEADGDDHALRGLRWSLGALVFGLGFATGLALAFLAATKG